MKKFNQKSILLSILVLLFTLSPFLIFAQHQETQLQETTDNSLPTEEDFIKIWEDGIKNDLETVVFEKLENKKYYFKTNRFPFDGELKIFDIYLDYGHTDYLCEDKYVAVEFKIKLTGVPENRFYYDNYNSFDNIKKEYRDNKNVKAYLNWYENNCCSFYYDYQTEKWLTSNEYEKIKCREGEPFEYHKYLFEFMIVPIVALLILLAVIVYNLKNKRK